MQTEFQISTHGPGLYEFTHDVTRWVAAQSVCEGLLTLFVRHTSCSLLVQENADPEVQTDLRNFFHRLVPPTTDPSMSYLTHTYEGPDDIAGPYQGRDAACDTVYSGVTGAYRVGDMAGYLSV